MPVQAPHSDINSDTSMGRGRKLANVIGWPPPTVLEGSILYPVLALEPAQSDQPSKATEGPVKRPGGARMPLCNNHPKAAHCNQRTRISLFCQCSLSSCLSQGSAQRSTNRSATRHWRPTGRRGCPSVGRSCRLVERPKGPSKGLAERTRRSANQAALAACQAVCFKAARSDLHDLRAENGDWLAGSPVGRPPLLAGRETTMDTKAVHSNQRRKPTHFVQSQQPVRPSTAACPRQRAAIN